MYYPAVVLFSMMGSLGFGPSAAILGNPRHTRIVRGTWHGLVLFWDAAFLGSRSQARKVRKVVRGGLKTCLGVLLRCPLRVFCTGATNVTCSMVAGFGGTGSFCAGLSQPKFRQVRLELWGKNLSLVQRRSHTYPPSLFVLTTPPSRLEPREGKTEGEDQRPFRRTSDVLGLWNCGRLKGPKPRNNKNRSKVGPGG